MKIKDARLRRYLRGRKKQTGTKDRPRLCLYRGLSNMNAQLVDDLGGKTILSVSTLDESIRKKFKNRGNIAASKALGELLTKKALEANIKKVRFDKSGYLYHGRVKEFAEACKKAGLQF
ncbi:MAG: 50S ribosomal protein L18 [Candidatus Omnitrophota bacterium]